MDRAVRHVDAFLAPSRFTAEMHAARGLDVPTVHLPLFIPEPRPLPPAAEPPNGGRPYVLFVGRLEKLKGLQDVIPTFGGAGDTDLVIVGDGNYRGELERLAAGSERVRFLGRQPFETLGPFYAGALALVLPSLCYETFGQVIMEAFAMRTPVVARHIGALAELVEESGGGRLFETESEFGRAVEELRADPALRERLAERGHAHYRQHGTVEHHLGRYLDLVHGLLERRHATASAQP
jgi:glycosyltransferase involved in cell wall biosynthesis